MKNPEKIVFLQLAMALPMCWCLTVAAAEEVTAATRVPLESMTRTEYENYRRQLNQKVNGVAANLPEQDATAAEKAAGESAEEDPEAKKDKAESNGYGKGYRARMERNTRTGRTGGYRGGSMSRGGSGRNH
ncbi:MAG: hypothetical protein KKH12_06760 [Gammaproteobacteria bacterium]|nr:hypothetical protein [Gammaproteobacteria bacterium]MBU1481360.1 hypothetical protein [Gammaproteobacteria bacterium]